MRSQISDFIVLTLLICVICGCSTHDKEGMTAGGLTAQEQADKFVSETIYIKNPETNLCYAYYWGGDHEGGPTVTLVPENSIPPGRLLIGRSTR